MKDEAPTLERMRWDTAILVCRACGKRSNGPKGMKPKALVSIIRRDAKAVQPRPRVLLTGCLGLCPKGAVAVAVVSASLPPRLIAVRSAAQMEAAMPLLIGDATLR